MSLSGYQNFFITFTDSNYDLQIFPQVSFFENHTVNKSLSRSINGSVHSFKIKESINYDYTFNLSFVNSSDAFRINDLWENQYPFQFKILNDDFQVIVLNSRITNRQRPMSGRPDQQFDFFEGQISLRSAENEISILPLSISPFILDDPVFGILDGTNGRLA